MVRSTARTIFFVGKARQQSGKPDSSQESLTANTRGILLEIQTFGVA
jgi:hypothetical protein